MPFLRELTRYISDLVGLQEDRWEGSGTARAGEYTFFYGKGNGNHELVTGFCVQENHISSKEDCVCY
jgi:hypothetical protein